ncbi:hypothetical protein [Helicobacter sp. 23-1045]
MEVLQRFKAFVQYIWDYKVEISFYAESKIAESSAKYTHPLTPSAREGEVLDSNFVMEGEQNIKIFAMADSAIFAESSKSPPPQ